MKNTYILSLVLIFLTIQINTFAQITPKINISCDINNRASEASLYNLKYKDITYATDKDGNKESAIRFNGQTIIKVNKDINPAVMPNLTVTFWAKPDFDNKRMTIFSHDNGDFDRSMAIDSRANGKWEWTAYCNKPIGFAKINKTKWTFVAITFNKKTNRVLICIDGKFYEDKASASSGLNYLHFGNNPSYGEPYYGLLDKIKIFDKSLTSEELTKIFNLEGGVIDNSDQYYYAENSNNADVVIRVGDMDNLGFGWPKGFDPFSGTNTSIHKYPWKTDLNDYKGTDKIMVISSYKSVARPDGYTARTKRPENLPEPINIKYKKPRNKINKVVIQMMLDDFQAPLLGTSYQFYINNKRLTYVENIINKLNQTGPIGKLVQIGLLPEDNHLFETGEVSIKIDDPITGAGDGFAIDFIQILINPNGKYKSAGSISGIVKDEKGNLLKDVLISANGLKEVLTNTNGHFDLQSVPIGIITLTASKATYSSASINFELKKDENKTVELILKKKASESENYIDDELKEKGFVNLYGIHFDSEKAIPKKESEKTLNELANFLKHNSKLKIKIVGHTDSDGDDKFNLELSKNRSKAVISWLKANGVNVSNIKSDGFGESRPIASNKTDAGKALNRRVEVLILNKLKDDKSTL